MDDVIGKVMQADHGAYGTAKAVVGSGVEFGKGSGVTVLDRLPGRVPVPAAAALHA